MKKTVILVISLFAFVLNAQSIEFGPYIGYGYDNTFERIDDKKERIGNPLYGMFYGGSAVYYFVDPEDAFSGRVGVMYKRLSNGTKSELYDLNYFEYKSDIIGVFAGMASNLGGKLIFYVDAGVGMSFNTTKNIYISTVPQQEAFPKLNEPLQLKANEITIIFDLGFERKVSKNFKAFAEISGDLGNSKINSTSQSFVSQSLGVGAGLRYVIPFIKKTRKKAYSEDDGIDEPILIEEKEETSAE